MRLTSQLGRVVAGAAITLSEASSARAEIGDLVLTIRPPEGIWTSSLAGFEGNLLVGHSGEKDYVSLYNIGSGERIRTYRKPDDGTGYWFGSSIAVVGNKVVVGCGDLSGSPSSVLGYVFDGYNGQYLYSLRSPYSAAQHGGYGRRVAAAGSNILVGSQTEIIDGSQRGAAFVFDGANGQLLRTFLSPSAVGGDRVGCAVAPLGVDVLVGADNDGTLESECGAAYLFDGQTGAVRQAFRNPKPVYQGGFGTSLADFHGSPLISAPGSHGPEENSGSVYLLDPDTALVTRRFLNPLPVTNGFFGRVLIPLEDYFVAYVAAYPTRHAALIIDAETGEVVHAFVDPESGENHYAESIAIVGNHLAIAARWSQPGGAVYIYESIPEPATLSLLAIGGLALIRRRRRK